MDTTIPSAPLPARSILVGCAGWSLPRAEAARFPAEGTHLQRYAARVPAVEINSSFYRPHRPATYARWSESVPAGFRFSVKVPKAITHELRLAGAGELVGQFLAEVSALDEKLGCLLVQLPPSLSLEAAVAESFFATLRSHYASAVVCEPRHPTWFTPEADELLRRFQISRVAADPAPVPEAAEPGGWPETIYYRLHGSPRMYYSSYADAYLAALAARLQKNAQANRNVWCIFDNTALDAAIANGLDLLERLRDDTMNTSA